MAILEVKNLCKRFGKTQVLRGVSFSMEKGEVVAIIGSSGSGKTTLLRCINFLDEADKGEISVDGETVFDGGSARKMSNAQLRKNQLNFGLVFQSFNLFPQYSALENVTLAPLLLAKEQPDYREKKKEYIQKINDDAVALLTRVGLSDRLGNYPCELSGGQQQRVSIARALMNNPKVLFFDEPTSALDPELTGEILRVIRDLAAKNVTMVIVTHEIEFAKNVADRIKFMSDVVVLEDGTPSEVFDNPKNEKTRMFLQKMNEK